MTDTILTSSRPVLPISVRSRGAESWSGRILGWIYPNRGWGSAERNAQPPPVDGQGKIGAIPGKPLDFRAGEAK